MKIKTGDNVKILSGREKGKTGKVQQVLFNEKKQAHYVVVENVNLRKKHMRSGRVGEPGQVIELPAPMHISNVMLIDPKTSKPSRVGYQVEDKKKMRIAKKSGEVLS